MKQPMVFVASLLTGVLLSAAIFGLTLRSQNEGTAKSSNTEVRGCALEICDREVSPPSPTLADQAAPTLAPPRPQNLSAKHVIADEVAQRQPVFLKVETNPAIEVNWATP